MSPPRDILPVRPFPVAPADVDEHVVRVVQRTALRQGCPMDEDDARLMAAMVIAATAEPSA